MHHCERAPSGSIWGLGESRTIGERHGSSPLRAHRVWHFAGSLCESAVRQRDIMTLAVMTLGGDALTEIERPPMGSRRPAYSRLGEMWLRYTGWCKVWPRPTHKSFITNTFNIMRTPPQRCCLGFGQYVQRCTSMSIQISRTCNCFWSSDPSTL